MIPTPTLEEQVANLTRLVLVLQERVNILEWRTQHFGYGQPSPSYPITPYTTYSDGKGHGMWPETKIKTSPASDN